MFKIALTDGNEIIEIKLVHSKLELDSLNYKLGEESVFRWIVL